MPTPNEKKALYFLALVAVSGSGVRLWRTRDTLPMPSATAQLGRQLHRVDSARSAKTNDGRKNEQKTERSTGRKTGRTTATTGGDNGREIDSIIARALRPSPGAPLDLDRAAVSEIEQLPDVSAALASRIAARRDSLGWLGSLHALCGVRGFDAALAEKLRPVVTFSGAPRPLSDVCGGASKKSRKSRDPSSRNRR